MVRSLSLAAISLCSFAFRYEKPKPTWPENGNEKPWQKPTSRPSYYPDKNEENQAQKWPPERPSWNKYTDRPNSEIITDNRPANFPNNWNRPQPTKPSYQFLDRYTDKNQGEEGNDWHDFPTRYDDRLRPSTERPGFSQYQYVNNHPQTYPGNSDGQWVLLSTNRGYSKSRQRSIKIDATNQQPVNGTRSVTGNRNEHDPAIAVMTSKRQVRLDDQRSSPIPSTFLGESLSLSLSFEICATVLACSILRKKVSRRDKFLQVYSNGILGI